MVPTHMRKSGIQMLMLMHSLLFYVSSSLVRVASLYGRGNMEPTPAVWPKQIGLVLGKCKHEIKALIN